MEEISLDINIDGLPVAKNGRCLWPILGAFPNVFKISPFVVGCYAGLKEPSNFDEFLADFVAEVNDLVENGFEVSRDSGAIRMNFKIRLFICDRPATCKISGTVSHVSKHGCPNCDQVGSRVNCVTVYSNETAHEQMNRFGNAWILSTTAFSPFTEWSALLDWI